MSAFSPISLFTTAAAALTGLSVLARPTPGGAAPAPDSPAKTTLGVLLFAGFEMLDAYGPMEIWGNLRHVPAELRGAEKQRFEVRIATVAARRGEIASNQGPKTVADFGYDDAPQADFLLVPGGMGILPLLKDSATLDWLRAQAKGARLVMSVCNGASLLAASGILDGRPATTNKMFWKMSTDPGPGVDWVKKARWVDDGDIVTSSGVSAGLDMTVAVIGRLYGRDVSDWLARLIEYEPHRDPSSDPFAANAGPED